MARRWQSANPSSSKFCPRLCLSFYKRGRSVHSITLIVATNPADYAVWCGADNNKFWSSKGDMLPSDVMVSLALSNRPDPSLSQSGHGRCRAMDNGVFKSWQTSLLWWSPLCCVLWRSRGPPHVLRRTSACRSFWSLSRHAPFKMPLN